MSCRPPDDRVTVAARAQRRALGEGADVLSDIEIADRADLHRITDVARDELGIPDQHLEIGRAHV